MNIKFTYWRSGYRKSPISVSLILAQLFIIISYGLFLHTHILDDGTRVVHAHFFNKGEMADNTSSQQNDASENSGTHHQHTSFSYWFFSNFDHFIKEGSKGFAFFRTGQFLNWSSQCFTFASVKKEFTALRAPPVV
ncbi:hypothetical protein [Marinilabilia salmonicolor]|uniref:hypothetical protein n=1 Tax=Marinilabilia salmonicolor TaxID=989 RepID=UPI0012F65D9B|nr:hypothetical protein [Marinilabilia salmonicolor]